MSRFRWVFIVLYLFLFSVNGASARSSASIIAFDQLIQPNESGRLVVRLETSGFSFFHRPVSGERIEFDLNNRTLGQTLTGGDGLAVLSFTPRKPGLYVFTVRLVENPRFDADPVRLYLACRKASDPILLVAISSLKISQPPAISFGPAPAAEVMPDAGKVLSRLSKRYQLLYLLTEDEAFIPATKNWLLQMEIPTAPLYAWPMSGEEGPRTDRFIERIREFRGDGWKNIPAGITRSKEDAEALSDEKIKAVLMAEEDDGELPPGTIKAKDWKSIPSLLK